MQNPANELRRIPLPRRSVNKGLLGCPRGPFAPNKPSERDAEDAQAQERTERLGNVGEDRARGANRAGRHRHHRHLALENLADPYPPRAAYLLLFSHPTGSHDDRLWALALACHGLRYGASTPKFIPAVELGRTWKPLDISIKERLYRQMWRTPKATEGNMRVCYTCGTKRPPEMENCPYCQRNSASLFRVKETRRAEVYN